MSGAEPLRERLSRQLRKAQSEWRMPGVSAAVYRDGAVLWQEALGLAAAEPHEPVTSDHQFRIGIVVLPRPQHDSLSGQRDLLHSHSFCV